MSAKVVNPQRVVLTLAAMQHLLHWSDLPILIEQLAIAAVPISLTFVFAMVLAALAVKMICWLMGI